MKKANSLIIILLFYLGWFGSVLLAKTSFSDLVLMFPAVLIAFLYFKDHLSLKSFLFASLVSIVGILFDSLLVKLNLIVAEAQTGWIIPLWLISIWLLFSFSMVKLGSLFRWPIWLASLLGFILGPISYKSGEIFNVLTFLSPWTFWIYATFWALAFPLVLIFSKRFT